jgi:hypothetical protein
MVKELIRERQVGVKQLKESNARLLLDLELKKKEKNDLMVKLDECESQAKFNAEIYYQGSIQRYKNEVNKLTARIEELQASKKELTNAVKLEEPVIEESKSDHLVQRQIVPSIQRLTEADITPIVLQLRAQLLLNQMNKEEFFKKVFDNCKESISITELAKELPLIADKGEILAQYIINQESSEQSNNTQIVQDELEKVIGITYSFSTTDELNDIVKQTLNKVKDKVLEIKRDSIDFFTEMNLNQWEDTFKDLELNQLEKDILVSIGFEGGEDINKLFLEVLAKD